jgi:hypothetical protein
VSARLGAFMVVLAACVAWWSRLLLGVDIWAALRATIAGNVPLIIWLGGLFVLAGLWQLVIGVLAALSHTDPINHRSLLTSVVVVSGVLIYGDRLGASLDLYERTWLHAFALALVGEGVANIFLQARGLWPRRASGYSADPSSPLFIEIVRLRSALNNVAADRDRIARQLADAPPLSREAEEVLRFPGVARAVLAALHPDRAKSDADKLTATTRFQTAAALLQKLGARQ